MSFAVSYPWALPVEDRDEPDKIIGVAKFVVSMVTLSSLSMMVPYGWFFEKEIAAQKVAVQGALKVVYKKGSHINHLSDRVDNKSEMQLCGGA